MKSAASRQKTCNPHSDCIQCIHGCNSAAVNRGDYSMIKNTEVKYTRREAKLIAEILDAARSEFYKEKDERGGSFKYFTDTDVERFRSISSSYYSSKVTSLALTLTEGDED